MRGNMNSFSGLF